MYVAPESKILAALAVAAGASTETTEAQGGGAGGEYEGDMV